MRRRGEFKRSQPGKRKKNYSLRHLLNYFLSNNIQRLILSVFSSETLNILKYDLCCVSAKLRTFLLVDSQVQDLYFLLLLVLWIYLRALSSAEQHVHTFSCQKHCHALELLLNEVWIWENSASCKISWLNRMWSLAGCLRCTLKGERELKVPVGLIDKQVGFNWYSPL